MTIRFMLDSITPEVIPTGAADIVGLYVNGTYKCDPTQATRLAQGGAEIAWISVDTASDEGDVLDIENGDATPQSAPAWYDARQKAGAGELTLYVNRTNLAAVQAAMGTRDYRLWVATLDGTTAVSGYDALAGPAAVQCLSAAMMGVNVDGSLVFDDTWKPKTIPAPPDPTGILARVVTTLTSDVTSAQSSVTTLSTHLSDTLAAITLLRGLS